MDRRYLYYGEILLGLLPEQDYVVRLEALAEALPLAVAATDSKGRVVVWNAALAAMAGPRGRALGRPILEALPMLAEDADVDWAEILAAVLGGGEALHLPRHPLGERVVQVTLQGLRGARREVLGAALSLEDITVAVREEEARRVHVRSSAVVALGAGIAHEIRNPLNALSLNLQLLRERLVDPGAGREALIQKTDTMIAEVDRMEALIQDLLEVSRGGLPARREESVDDLIDDVVGRLEDPSREAGVGLHVSRNAKRLLPIDRTSIERAILNMVENARDAAGGGGNVGIAPRDDPHSTVVVVDDDGPGIDRRDRERVFELFWTRKRGGTGLGLPLARRAVERHGGELEVMQRPGGGSRFVIHLPRGDR
ncbi:MAG: PAS domain-containing sensor histidine kinase [Planctomycetota bacterium]